MKSFLFCGSKIKFIIYSTTSHHYIYFADEKLCFYIIYTANVRNEIWNRNRISKVCWQKDEEQEEKNEKLFFWGETF